jgi:hypothetical protein
MKKEKDEPLKWTLLGSLSQGYEVEATYAEGVVVIRGHRSPARTFDRLVNGGGRDRPDDRILSHETYALTRESVLAMLRLFPKKEGKKR